MTAESFWSRVDAGAYRTAQPPPDPEPHWTWLRSRAADGRPLAWYRGKLRLAYRVAWELIAGRPLDNREELWRQCAEPACVNPAHYELFTRPPDKPFLFRRGNVARKFRLGLDDAALAAQRSGVEWYCGQGHALKPGVKRKDCPECQNERRRNRRVLAQAAITPTPPANDIATYVPTDAPQIDLPDLPF